MFLYSQDLSNCTTAYRTIRRDPKFLYSQDLSNCTTPAISKANAERFLYSQDLSNCTTKRMHIQDLLGFCTLKI